MSAILSADDLNDFISPGVACIKPIETIPATAESTNPYEVTTEEKAAAANPTPATISLTDCLACSGCVTSAEAVLVSLQSHNEVLNTLDAHPSLPLPWLQNGHHGHTNGASANSDGKIFVASVSPQTRANIAAAFNVSEREAGNMIAQLLSGSRGLSSGGSHGSGFTWVLDTNVLREAALVLAADEVSASLQTSSSTNTRLQHDDGSPLRIPTKPVLTSACPGWICYAEKTHPHILPHLSRLKSPQALTGTLLKSVLSTRYGIQPSQVWHLAIMPCFDKKLEAARTELTSSAWSDDISNTTNGATTEPIRDVDCVITARELLLLASSRNIHFPSLPRTAPVLAPFPDPRLNTYLFPKVFARLSQSSFSTVAEAASTCGTSGGYLWHTLHTMQRHHPDTTIRITRGRNADVIEYDLIHTPTDTPIFRAARYYGFRNIQNLVRRLKPAKISRLGAAAAARRGGARKPGTPAPASTGNGIAVNGAAKAKEEQYAYVEVMACPGGCTNGGGQIKAVDLAAFDQDKMDVDGSEAAEKSEVVQQKMWLAQVDEAYFSAGSSDDEEHDNGAVNGSDLGLDAKESAEDVINGVDTRVVYALLEHWSQVTGIEREKLVYTGYRKVESDVGKKVSDVERVAGLAGSVGGGW